MSAMTILACATCYGAKDSPLTQGFNAGILVLLGVTALVWGGLAAFIIALVRRSRRLAKTQAAGGVKLELSGGVQ